jgi:hypothetical protein
MEDVKNEIGYDRNIIFISSVDKKSNNPISVLLTISIWTMQRIIKIVARQMRIIDIDLIF